MLTDSAGVAAGYATSVSILPHVALSGLCTQQCSVEAGCMTVCGAFSDISGGVQPYTFALTQGSIPAGMTLNGLALAGTFPTPGVTINLPPPYMFTVGVTDALGATASVNSVFVVFSHITMQGGSIPLSPNAPCFFTPGAPQDPNCTVNFPYGGGTPGGTPTASFKWIAPFPQTCSGPGSPPPTPCPQPPLPSVTVGGGNVTIAVGPGTSDWFNGYTGTLQVVLTDQSPCAPGPVMCSSAPVQITITQQGG